MVQGAHHQNSVVSPLKISAIPDTQYCSTEKNLLLLSNDLYCIAIYMYCDLWCSGGNRNVTTLHPPPPFGGGSKRAGVIWSSPHHRTLVPHLPHLFHVYLPHMAVATLYCRYSRSLQATSYDEMGTYMYIEWCHHYCVLHHQQILSIFNHNGSGQVCGLHHMVPATHNKGTIEQTTQHVCNASL